MGTRVKSWFGTPIGAAVVSIAIICGSNALLWWRSTGISNAIVIERLSTINDRLSGLCAQGEKIDAEQDRRIGAVEHQVSEQAQVNSAQKATLDAHEARIGHIETRRMQN